MLDPAKVLVFQAVVRQGSISAAARTLGWTQPAVSQQMRSLERAAGTPLLARSSKGVTPTEAGRVLLGHAEVIIGHLEAADEVLRRFANLERGTVRLTAFPSALATLVPSLLSRLRAASGAEVELLLSENEPPEALDALRGGVADVALTFVHDDLTEVQAIPDDLRGLPVGSDEVVVILPAGDARGGQPTVELARLAEDDWIAGCARCRNHLVHQAHQAGFDPRIRHQIDDYVTTQALVAQGLAVSMVPSSTLTAYRYPGIVALATAHPMRRHFYALHRPGAERVAAVRLVIRLLRELSQRT
ncbi:MAG: LysR family transcriptional regulator [Propionibacteriaceae bacterium]|jgi:DNA-binding transcriptional LysR family regulator|nr:LysR family transcriptional regulator [Propionibacteriaceae bacterium]